MNQQDKVLRARFDFNAKDGKITRLTVYDMSDALVQAEWDDTLYRIFTQMLCVSY